MFVNCTKNNKLSSEYQNIIEKWTNTQPLETRIITLFEKVRDIPYGDIGSRNPLDVYKQNKGTCSGKHELLKALYKQLGIPVKDFIITHCFKELPILFPTNIQKILENTDIIDPHNFIKIEIEDNWITIDVTWDKNLKKLGFPVNENWDGRTNMNISVAQGCEIYETENPIGLKEELLAKLLKVQQKERKIFLKKVTEWLDNVRE